jgi:hypothetical protein
MPMTSGESGANHYFCRGCGLAIEDDPRGKRLFHPDCLAKDKRNRIIRKRAAERERFERWLAKKNRAGRKRIAK